MKRTIQYISIIVAILLSPILIYGVECGSSPVEDCQVTTSTTFLQGIYSFNDTGNGSIRIAASNLILDCNGSTIYGNNSPDSSGIFTTTSFRNNVTIQNCIFYGYEYGIFDRNSGNLTLYNHTIYNCTRGITCGGSPCRESIIDLNRFENNTNHMVMDRFNSSVISNNTLINPHSSGMLLQFAHRNIVYGNTINKDTNADGSGIRLYTEGDGNWFFNNTITSHRYGIWIENVNENNVSDNTVSGSGLWNIAVLGNNSHIYLNTITNSYWNLIRFGQYDGTIHNNNLNGYLHHGIDTHHSSNETVAGRWLIYNNNITQNISNYNFTNGESSIYIAQANDCEVYDNHLYDLFNSTISSTGSRGIAVEGGDFTRSNWIYNNSFDNVSGYCIYDDSLNTTWQENSLTLCQRSARVFGAWNLALNITYARFINNTEDDTFHINISNTRVNISIDRQDSYSISLDTSDNAQFTAIVPTNRQDYIIRENDLWEFFEYANTLPYEGMNITTTTTFTNGTFHFYSGFYLGAGNVTVDGQHGTYFGNYTYGGYAWNVSNYDNFTIRNFRFDTWRTVIGMIYPGSSVENLTVANCNFNNLSRYGMNLDNPNFGIIENNTFRLMNFTAIRLHSTVGVIVRNNDINTSCAPSVTGINIDGRENWIDNNQIYMCSNQIAIFLPNDGTFKHINNTISNNTIYGNTLGYGFLNYHQGAENYFIDNNFTNLRYGSLEIGNNTFIWNNTFNTMNEYCLYSRRLDNNSFIVDNEFTDCKLRFDASTNHEVRLNTYSSNLVHNEFNENCSNINFRTNTYIDNLGRYKFYNSQVTDISINESPTTLIFNNTLNGMIKWIGTQLKFINSSENSSVIKHLSGSNDLFNSSGASPTHTDTTAQVNETITAGNRLFIITYSSANDPRFSSIATTVTDISYTFSGSSVEYTVEGTGDVTLTNLDQLRGSLGYYNVLRNGAVIDREATNEYTTTGAGTYTIVTTEFGRIEGNSRTVVIALGIMIALVVIMFIVGAIVTGTVSAGFLLAVLIASIIALIIIQLIWQFLV